MAHSYSTDPFWLSLGLTFTKLKIQDAQTLIFEYANSVDELSLSPSRVWELFPLKKELFAIIYRNQHEMRKSSSKVLERKEGQGKLPNEQSLRGFEHLSSVSSSIRGQMAAACGAIWPAAATLVAVTCIAPRHS